jgi:hypothetical protein
MSFFGLGYRDIPKHVLPSVVLSVENELGINAGLQVRTTQTSRPKLRYQRIAWQRARVFCAHVCMSNPLVQNQYKSGNTQ